MMNIFISVITGVFVVFPFFISICLYIFQRWTGRSRSMKKNADYTTPFLFLSVYVIAHTLFGDGTGYWIFTVAILIGLFYAVYEKKRVKDFEISLLFRKIWRLLFILLTISYLLLIATGLVLTMIDYTR